MPTKAQSDAAYWKEMRADRPNAPKNLHNRRPECLPTEDADAYDGVEAEWYESLQPAFPEELSYVDDIVYNVWMLERLDRTQVQLYTYLHENATYTHPDFPLGQPLAENPKAFNALAWRYIAVRKALRDALDGFKDLRANPLPYRPAPPPPAETIQTTSPEIGFEFSTSPAARDTLASEQTMSKPEETVEARRWIVSGRVQGVGYRYFAQRAAVELALTGFARNLPDGSVEVHAAGPPEKLSVFAGLLHQGPRWGEVRTVREEEAAVTHYDGFQIR